MSGSAPRAVVLSVSTSRAEGSGEEDHGGAELERWATEALGAEMVARELVPDVRALIEDRIKHFADAGLSDIVLTTGGTGFAPDDVTPEATLAVADRLAPGIAEAMRLASRDHTPHWMLSRNEAVIRGSTLVVNFPGSPKAIGEAGAAIAEALPHALKLLIGERDAHR